MTKNNLNDILVFLDPFERKDKQRKPAKEIAIPFLYDLLYISASSHFPF